jgi:hypothetical protein
VLDRLNSPRGLDPGHDARIEPDMQAAILSALRLDSDRSEPNVPAIAA